MDMIFGYWFFFFLNINSNIICFSNFQYFVILPVNHEEILTGQAGLVEGNFN